MLSAEEKAEMLEGGIFGGLDEEMRLKVAQRMGQRDLRDDEILFLNGEPGEEIYVVVKGKIEIYMEDHSVAILDTGQVFGEMAVFGGGLRRASARAIGETQLLFLKDKAMKLLLQQDPNIAFGLFHVMSERLDEANLVARFLAGEKTEYGTVEVVSGELAGKTFPLYHSDAPLGCARGGVGDYLRTALPVEGDDLMVRHARVTVSGNSIFILPQDGEVLVNGEPIDDSIGVGPDDRVELGGLTLRFSPRTESQNGHGSEKPSSR